MIHLRFTRNKSLVSDVIRLATWSPWSHVEFVLLEGYLSSFLGAITLPDGIRIPGGVQLRPFDYAPDDTYQLAHIDCSQAVAKKVIDYAKLQIGKPYDLTGVIGLGLHRDWHKANAWFCSELVFASCEQGGIQLLAPIPEDRATPGLLFDSPRVVRDNIVMPSSR